MDIIATIGERKEYDIWTLIRLFEHNDVHKWIIGRETGKGGHRHLQCRWSGRGSLEDWTNAIRALYGDNRQVHTEEAKTKIGELWAYEGKDGKYLASWDSTESRMLRFGTNTARQNVALKRLYGTNDREIMVWYDDRGNSGKSWLSAHLIDSGQAYYCPPYMTSVKEMVQSVASQILEDRKSGYPARKIVIIDIPRSWKWSKDLYTAIETIKDGLIMDGRYSAKVIVERGLKVLVLTNSYPKIDALSEDRWVIHNEDDITTW